MKEKQNKRFSLKWRMIWRLIVCWLLPVIVTVLVAANYLLYQSIQEEKELLLLNANNAMELATSRLHAATESSRAASYIPTIRSAWWEYEKTANKIKLYEASGEFLYQQYKYDEKFQNTTLFLLDFPEEPIYVRNKDDGTIRDLKEKNKKVFAQASALSANLGTGIAFFKLEDELYMMRNLVDSRYAPFAILCMQLDTTMLFGEFGAIVDTECATIAINDTEISFAAQDVTPDSMPFTLSVCDSVVYEDNLLQVFLQKQYEDYKLSYRAYTDPIALRAQQFLTIFVVSMLLIFMLPLGATVIYFFVRHVTGPIEAIIRVTNKIRAEEYGTHVGKIERESKEIGTLCDNVNLMSDTLKEQFEHIYKEELALRDARMMALQSQINPHFLNNTLEIINWEARMQGNLKVCNMMESLSTMLNAAMDRTKRPLVHLSEEMMYVDAYLYIINERLGQRLVFEKEIPEVFLDAYVPRLILQPIIENAVEHGITPTQRGRIVLRAYQEGAWLMLEVENEGEMSERNASRVRQFLSQEVEAGSASSERLGLRNVHERLRILYGEESGVLVDVTKKDATIFKMKVKLTEYAQE